MTQKHVIYILSIVFLLYFSGLHFDLSVVVVRPADILLCLLLFLVLNALLVSGEILNQRIKLSRIFLIYLVYIFYRLLNGLLQSGPSIAIKELLQSVLIISFAMLLAHFCDTTEKRRQLLELIKKLLILASIVLFLYFVQIGQPFGFKTFGPFKHLYGLAGLFVVQSFLDKPSRSSFLLLAVTVMIMLFSGEKKGWIGLSFASLYLLSTLYLKVTPQMKGYARLSITTFLFVALISMPILLPSNPYIARQLQSLSEVANIAGSTLFDEEEVVKTGTAVSFSSRSNISRFYVLSTALQQVERTPLFGIGPQNLKALILESTPFAWMDPGAHNDYLNTLVEYGVIGLLFQLLLLLLLWQYSSYLLRRCRNTETRQQVIFLRAMLIFGVVINAFFGGSDALNSLYILVPAGLLFSVNPLADGDLRTNKEAIPATR